ncbi:sensor histidine kinase [Marinomonas algarum]|uniref:histidine kinase n=1 Tax=Marinomonas algarum TaxID=2883105 RepID=A0A9X1IM20_9GAMM|nr:HAMP domain-containing sensor histidine kinase [Marinomonas algarum]MCB5161715.1 HAMP domain-containing histidine kinase [Marinomonas algarum]
MALRQPKPWLSKFKNNLLYAFITLIMLIALAVFGIISYTSDSSKNNGRRVFESALWNALQLQVQTYRFLNYLVRLDATTPEPQDKAFFEYDLLMSRVDLLRRGEVGELVRNFESGRITRLLNIINGELELMSFQLSKIESGDLSYLPSLIERIEDIDPQINEFVTLVNKASNEYITDQRRLLQTNLDHIKLLSTALLACLLFLCFFVIRSVDELRRSHRQNKTMLTDVQSVQDDKANMLAYIHQEIRSPINAILSVANTLKHTTPQDSVTLSRHIEESGHALLHTIEMLSDLARMDAKQWDFHPNTEPLRPHIEACFTSVERQISRKALQGMLYIDPQLPKELCLDFPKLKDIVLALLQNAIAHTAAGSLCMQVRAAPLTHSLGRSSDNGKEIGFLQIVLKDTGQGMSRELQQHLRANPSLPVPQNSPTPNQVGLSLALCHRLIYLMKGEMHFSSTQQKGSEFWVNIPFYPSTASHVSQNVAFSCPDKSKALVIETDAHLADTWQLYLNDLNMDVIVTQEGSLQEYQDCDLVILGNTARFTREGDDALHLWKKRRCPVLSYHPQAIEHAPDYVIPVHFPLMQASLDALIAPLFTEHSRCPPTTSHATFSASLKDNTDD